MFATYSKEQTSQEEKSWENTTVLGQQIPVLGVAKDFAKKEVALCKRVGAETLLEFGELDGDYLFPTEYAPVYPGLKGRDLLKELVAECKENGIRFVAAFMGQHVQRPFIRKHPDWVYTDYTEAKNPKFDPLSQWWVCINSPYRQALQGMTYELIEKYGVDAVYYDGVYYD